VITLFALPRAFEGDADVAQRNALASWVRLGPQVEVLLIGADAGVAAAAAAAGVRHEERVAVSPYGTPLLDSAFALAREASSRRLLAYVNADIVLLPDFVETIRRIRFGSFLCVGRRWNVPLTEPLDFGSDYGQHLQRLLASAGELALPDAVDYFALDRAGPLTELPPFVVGRPGWDNWMILRARSLGVPVIDATRTITAIHPSHGYEHVPERGAYRWSGPEAEANFALMKGIERLQTRHATHVATRLGILPALTPRRIVSRVRSRHAVDGRVERTARLAERALHLLTGRSGA
jgi:hypothetical protein